MKKYGSMKALALVGIILLALTWAGCTSVDAPSKAPSSSEATQANNNQTQPKAQPAPPAAPKEKAKEKTQPQKPKDFRIGDTAYFNDSKVTVISFTPGTQSTNQFMQPEAGKQFASADVEGCANNNATTKVTLNPFDFQLIMQDNTRLTPTFSGPEPDLNHGELLPGDCLRGYVTFEVPQGQNAKAVLYAKMISNKQPTKWTI